MNNLARKLMTLVTGEQTNPNLPSSIFGTASQLGQNLDTRPPIRIGVWPCVSADSPGVAMGLMTVLAFLLDRWRDVRAYRLFARLEGDPRAYQWSMGQSQFDVDDWQLDQLDENVAVWGTLERSGDQWQLAITVENDLDEDAEEETDTYQAENIAALVTLLPQVAQDIIQRFETRGAVAGKYDEVQAGDESLRVLLSDLFDWQLKLLLAVWGKPWPEFEIKQALEKLIRAGQAVGGEFGAWSVTNAVAHAMLPGYESINETVAAEAPRMVEQFGDTAYPAIFISSSLYRMGYAQQAYELLEADVIAHPDSVASWLTLAELYRSAGRLLDAADTFQQAIEAGATSAILFTRYADLLTALNADNWDMDEYILLDLEPEDLLERRDELLLLETVEAYGEAFRLAPEQVNLLSQQLLILIDLEEVERLWAEFARLVELDKKGEAVRTVADALYNVADLEPAIAILKRQIEQEPERCDLYVNLAVTYLSADEGELAAETLEKAEELTDADDVLADIERLLLSADDPEFEARLGELSAVASAGNTLNTKDVEFLEAAIEQAPSLGEAYVTLAKAYAAWGEEDTALETLMDGHENAPEDPDIVEMMAQMLWQAGERELAFNYLNKGVNANPNHVPLLALTGQYLFENGQEEDAKVYLARAEGIGPRHPALARARVNITQFMNRRQ
jgi:tetratricopeptide (TPR) repeat protein